ncbi:hypothetical protein [Bordetella muralis]|jgi:hypothetical protein|uniref:hypothetical protein n=1 Tax=Bordetella muralis TaxID=1649130 RepID=UPI0039EE0D97
MNAMKPGSPQLKFATSDLPARENIEEHPPAIFPNTKNVVPIDAENHDRLVAVGATQRPMGTKSLLLSDPMCRAYSTVG